MAATVKELKQWLDSLEDDARLIYVDEGGLTIRAWSDGLDAERCPYIEVGGEPNGDDE